MKNNLLRVTQMNAIYLDKEIYKTFHNLIQEATRNLPPGLIAPFESEISLLLTLAILNNSIIKSGNTFGQQLLSIKYESISPIQKASYLIANCMDYARSKFEAWLPPSDMHNTIFKIYMFIKLLDFVNLSIFLRNGVKPLLIERILGLTQVYASENDQRKFESKYLARELLWNGFIEILVYVLPLVNYHKIKRAVKSYNPLHKKSSQEIIHKRNITIHSRCAYCGENPILPHHMGCSHIFCYVCLAGNQSADSKFECPVCEHKNQNILCDRVTVL